MTEPGGGSDTDARFDRTHVVNRLAQHVQHAAERLLADRHGDGAAQCLIAFMPRTSPSVGCIAMVRTRPSPMCCATSADDIDRFGDIEAFTGNADGGIDDSGICPSGN